MSNELILATNPHDGYDIYWTADLLQFHETAAATSEQPLSREDSQQQTLWKTPHIRLSARN